MRISRTQIESQLQRMLKSETFTGGIRVAPEKSAQLLGHIVTASLTGESLTERALLLDFFGYTADQLLITRTDIDVARIGVLRLRKKLKAYYEGEGLDDSVRIDIPKGQYKADFSVNESSRSRKELRQGYILVEQEDEYVAKKHFLNALSREPALADAWAGIAAASRVSLNYKECNNSYLLAEAETASQKALTIDDNCWRAHAEIGALHLFRHEWEAAESAFRKAKQIAPLKLMHADIYATFLVSCGYNEEARELAHFLNEQIERPYLQIRSAHILYTLGESETAREMLSDIKARNRNIWQIYWLDAWICIQQGEVEEAYSSYLGLQKRISVPIDQALAIFCHEGIGEHQKATELFGGMHHYVELSEGIWGPAAGRCPATVDYALACLSQGDEERAIKYLSIACDIADPFTAGLHTNPLLTPLRKHRSFRELLKKWNYPMSALKGRRFA